MPIQGVVTGGFAKPLVGRLRHRLQIVLPTKQQDSTGGMDLRQNTVVMQTWGAVEALTATEKFAAHEFTSQVTHKVWIRHPRTRIDPTGQTSGVTADMQVWFGTRQFQVEGVLNPVEKKDWLLLMCVEIDDSKNQAGVAPPEATS